MEKLHVIFTLLCLLVSVNSGAQDETFGWVTCSDMQSLPQFGLHAHNVSLCEQHEAFMGKITESKFGLCEYKDKRGRRLPCYLLTKTECLYIATKFYNEAPKAFSSETVLESVDSFTMTQMVKELTMAVFDLTRLLNSMTSSTIREHSTGLTMCEYKNKHPSLSLQQESAEKIAAHTKSECG